VASRDTIKSFPKDDPMPVDSAPGKLRHAVEEGCKGCMQKDLADSIPGCHGHRSSAECYVRIIKVEGDHKQTCEVPLGWSSHTIRGTMNDRVFTLFQRDSADCQPR